MAGSKDKVPALVLDLPGAPAGWHTVEGLTGLVHPDIPVPHLNAEQFVKAHRDRAKQAREAWDKHERAQEAKDPSLRVHGRIPFPEPPCPVKVVHVTRQQAEDGQRAHDVARKEALGGLRAARRSSDDTEAALAHNESAALAGGEG